MHGGVEIGDSNYFGVKSTILQNIKIGNKNIIGGASLVINDIEDNSKVIGIPAKLYIKK